MADLRIGLIGASRVAAYAVVAAAREITGIRVSSIASRDPQRARRFAREHGISKVHDNYEQLFRDQDLDLVYLGTPPSLHAQQALLAIAAGKSVLVEKPFAVTSAEARYVAMMAAQRNVAVFEAMHSPHHQLFGRVLELLRSGVIGPLQEIEGRFDAPIERDDPFRWQSEFGGGALMDLGVYPLALVRRIAGEDFTVTSAKAVMSGGVDESFWAELAYQNGLKVRIAASMVPARPSLSMVIRGEHGTLDIVNPYVPHLGHRLIIEANGQRLVETYDGLSSYAAQLAAIRATLLELVPYPHRAGDYVRSMEAIETIRRNFTR